LDLVGARGDRELHEVGGQGPVEQGAGDGVGVERSHLEYS